MKTKFASISNVASAFAAGKTLIAFALFAAVVASSLRADSLWTSNRGRETSMFSDRRARRVGDILTVVVQESASVQASNRTKSDRTSSVDNAVSQFLFSAAASGLGTHMGELPATKFGGTNTFSGGGEITNKQTINARAAVTVIDVLPNGNLVIEGSRYVAYSGEKQYAVLRGIVRPDDVLTGNTVASSSIADARVEFLSHGAITTQQNKGWFTRVFDKINPF